MFYFSLIIALGGIGILNTAYLSYHSITKTPVKCMFFPPEWCLKVQQSKYSRTLGIPNSFLGFIMYSLITCLALFARDGQGSMGLLYFFIAFGFAFSIYFMIIQGAVLRAYCTWCVLSFIDFTLMGAATMFLR